MTRLANDELEGLVCGLRPLLVQRMQTRYCCVASYNIDGKLWNWGMRM